MQYFIPVFQNGIFEFQVIVLSIQGCLFKTIFHIIDFEDLKDWYVSIIVTWLSVACGIVSLISYDN